jgi:MFS family permease
LTDGGADRLGNMLLTAFFTAGLGFAGLGLVLLVVASVIDQHRRKGHLLRPWDLAMIPMVFIGIIGLGICGTLAAIGPVEDDLRRRGALADILLTMVGVEEPARPGWVAPAWVALILLVTCVVQSRRLQKRIPDL